MDVIVPEISGIPEISKWSLKFPEIPYFPYFPDFPYYPYFQVLTQNPHKLVIGPRNAIFSL